MVVFYNENFRNFDTIREMATVILNDKMFEERSSSMNDYIDGWIQTMNEIDSESIEEGEIFTPYNKNSIMSTYSTSRCHYKYRRYISQHIHTNRSYH